MRKTRMWLIVGLIAAMAPVVASAVELCTQGTMADYVALGAAGCVIDDKLFYNFAYSSALVPAGSVAVAPISMPYNPGFAFSAGWGAIGSMVVDSHITYYVAVLQGGFPIGDISAAMTGYVAVGNGFVLVAENAWLGGPPGQGGTQLMPPLGLYATASGSQDYDREVFGATRGPIFVAKDILVSGGGSGPFQYPPDFASVSQVINQFSEVPEPITLVLIGSGLLGFGLLRRRFPTL